MLLPYASLLLALLLPFAAAQDTITTTDADAETVVEVITTGLDGLATTNIIQTLTASPTTATVTTTDGAGETVIEVITDDGLGDLGTQTIQTITAAATTATVTTTDNAGETVVEVITGDGQGDTGTQTIQTLTADQGGAGPVGQPASQGNAGEPTPFTYTTTDAAGDTINVVGTFTPSLATTIAPSATFKATVLNYSQYTASYAKQVQTQNANTKNNAAMGRLPAWSWASLFSVAASVLSGMMVLWGA